MCNCPETEAAARKLTPDVIQTRLTQAHSQGDKTLSYEYGRTGRIWRVDRAICEPNPEYEAKIAAEQELGIEPYTEPF
jgi:hypothetical protein